MFDETETEQQQQMQQTSAQHMDDDMSATSSVVEISAPAITSGDDDASSSSSGDNDEHNFQWKLQGVSLWNINTAIQSGGVTNECFVIIHGLCFEMSVNVSQRGNEEVVSLFLHANQTRGFQFKKTAKFSCKVSYKLILERKSMHCRKLTGTNPTTGWQYVTFTEKDLAFGGEFMGLKDMKEDKNRCVVSNGVKFTCRLRVQKPILR